MNRFLQINLNCAKAAQDLMCQLTTEERIDYVIVSEYNSAPTQNWYTDSNRKAAINCMPNCLVDNLEQSEPGLRWIATGGMRLYSCYWSPNTTFAEYVQFLSWLETSVRGNYLDEIIAGNFNA